MLESSSIMLHSKAPPQLGYDAAEIILNELPYDYTRYEVLSGMFEEKDVKGQMLWKHFCTYMFDDPVENLFQIFPTDMNWKLVFDAFLYSYRNLRFLVRIGDTTIVDELYFQGSLGDQWTSSVLRPVHLLERDEDLARITKDMSMEEFDRIVHLHRILHGQQPTMTIVVAIDEQEIVVAKTTAENHWRVDYATTSFHVGSNPMGWKNRRYVKIFFETNMPLPVSITQVLKAYKVSNPEEFDRRASLTIAE